MTSHITLSPLHKKDIPTIVNAFAKASWSKPAITFEEYFKEQTQNQRCVWLAFEDNHFTGYVTLKWESHYEPFRAQNIPEIMDLKVLPDFRNRGIGSLLIERAEEEAFKQCDTVGIGVGLYADYGQAIKIYIDRGYKPDGRGVTYNYQSILPGNSVCLDDELVLWFSKKRSSFLNGVMFVTVGGYSNMEILLLFQSRCRRMQLKNAIFTNILINSFTVYPESFGFNSRIKNMH